MYTLGNKQSSSHRNHLGVKSYANSTTLGNKTHMMMTYGNVAQSSKPKPTDSIQNQHHLLDDDVVGLKHSSIKVKKSYLEK